MEWSSGSVSTKRLLRALPARYVVSSSASSLAAVERSCRVDDVLPSRVGAARGGRLTSTDLRRAVLSMVPRASHDQSCRRHRVLDAASYRRRPRIHQPWLPPWTWLAGPRSACRGSPCEELVTAASFLAQLFDLCLLAQRVRGNRLSFCRADAFCWRFGSPIFLIRPHVQRTSTVRLVPLRARGSSLVRSSIKPE